MERNAAGELIVAYQPHPSTTETSQQQTHMMTSMPPQVTSIRFKMYFSTQPQQQSVGSSNKAGTHSSQHDGSALSSSPSSLDVEHRAQQLAHLMIPFRLPFSPDLTLQGLADQAAGRISKRYAALTEKYEIEGFDVIPLMWDGMLVGAQRHEQQSEPQQPTQQQQLQQITTKPIPPKPPVVGQGQQTPSPKSTGSSGWFYDTNSTYRLDLAMNGPDEAEFYFALPPHSTTAPFHNNPAAMISLGSPPPFELMIVWTPRAGVVEVDHNVHSSVAPIQPQPLQPLASPSHSLPSQQALFPIRPSSVEGSSGLSGNGGRSSPAVVAVTVTSSKPPLPPIIPRGSTPTQASSKLAAMEPRKPQEGTARFHRQPTPPSLSAQLGSNTVPFNAEINVTSNQHHHKAGSSEASPHAAMNVSNSAEENELRGLRNYYLPRHNSDSIIDISGNHTPQRSAISPPTTGSAGRQQGSGRRSVTTFVEEDGLLIVTGGEGAPLVAASLPPGPQPAGAASLAAAPNGPSSTTTTRNTSPDSESNAEDAVGFQAQLIAMTESEDRDAILMQEDMESQSTLRSHRVAVDLILSSSFETVRNQNNKKRMVAAQNNPPIVYDMKIEVPAAAAPAASGQAKVHHHHLAASPLPLDVREHRGGMLAAMTSPSPPSVRSTMERLESPTSSSAACSTPNGQAQQAAVAPQVESPIVDAQIPTPRGKAVPPPAAAAATMALRRSSRDDHTAVTSASVLAALAFTAVPTSQNVIDQLRLSQSEERREDAEVESDDEAVLLACDELLHDWLQLRHAVLTDERKLFRVIVQQSKMFLRELQGGETMTTIRDEALAQHAHIKAITSPGKFSSSASSASVSPSRDREERLSAAPSPIKQPTQPPRYPTGSGLSSYEVEARGVGLSTPPVPMAVSATSPQRFVAQPPPPPQQQPQQQRHHIDEAVLRLLKIIEVTEQADRREISDAQHQLNERMREDAIIGSKRIELRAEQALINNSCNTLHDERQRRAELMEVEDRKFSMFASLCNKGIARIKASEAGSRGGST